MYFLEEFSEEAPVGGVMVAGVVWLLVVVLLGMVVLGMGLLEQPVFVAVLVGMISQMVLFGDLLVVDRAVNASNNHVVVAVLNGEMTVKRLKHHQHDVWLLPENKNYKPIKVRSAMAFSIWGVVTHVIHAL